MRAKEPFVVVCGEVEAKFSRVADIIELTNDLVFIIPDFDIKITLKKGFRSDGASLPRSLWRCIGHPFFHSYLLAALLHDALYQTELLPRRLADMIFRRFMAQLARDENRRCWLAATTKLGKARTWIKGRWRLARPWIMWVGVRLGGGFVWRVHTAAGKAASRELVAVS